MTDQRLLCQSKLISGTKNSSIFLIDSFISTTNICYLRHFTSSNIDVSQKSATERKKLLDSGEIETSVELKFEEAKSVSQLWEALLNYDAVYSHLHPMDYGPNVLMRIMVHYHSFANL